MKERDSPTFSLVALDLAWKVIVNRWEREETHTRVVCVCVCVCVCERDSESERLSNILPSRPRSSVKSV